MYFFTNFWKLETENNHLHVFSFLHKLSFENNFCFLSILGCQTSFLISKLENSFWKQKINGKNCYQTYYFLKSFFEKPTITTIQKLLAPRILNYFQIQIQNLAYLFNQILKNVILLKYKLYWLQAFWITFKFNCKF